MHAYPIIGRDPELAALEELLAAIPSATSALVVEGEAGAGKTTLWAHTLSGAGNDTANGGDGTDTCSADPGDTVISCP